MIVAHKGARLQIICDTCGANYSLTPDKYRNKKDKSKCAACSPFARKTYDFIQDEFGKRGYNLLTTTYKNAFQKLQYRCERHPESTQQIIYNSLQRGTGCRFCRRDARQKQRRVTLEKVRLVTEERGFTFVSVDDSEVLNSKTYVNYQCPKHPNAALRMRYNNIQQGFGCPLCYDEKPKKYVPQKDGSTPIQAYLRKQLVEWEFKSRERSNCTCVVSGKPATLVHHLISFTFIMYQAFVACGIWNVRPRMRDYAVEELDAVSREVIRLHEVLGTGVCVTPAIHREFHSKYPQKFTEQDFWKFAKEYPLTNEKRIEF